MRILVFLAAVAVVGLVLTGAIKLQKSSDRTISIQIDKDKVEEEAELVLEKGKAALHEAESSLQEAAQDSTRH